MLIFQTKRGWVRVRLLQDKQHKTHMVRKCTLRLGKMPSVVSIRPILNKIQLFKNFKIYKIGDEWIYFMVN